MFFWATSMWEVLTCPFITITIRTHTHTHLHVCLLFVCLVNKTDAIFCSGCFTGVSRVTACLCSVCCVQNLWFWIVFGYTGNTLYIGSWLFLGDVWPESLAGLLAIYWSFLGRFLDVFWLFIGYWLLQGRFLDGFLGGFFNIFWWCLE